MKKFIHSYGIALLVLALAYGAHTIYNYYERNVRELPYYGNQDEGEISPIPDFEFLSEDSVMVKKADYSGQILVTNYFFTSCPSICPKMNRQMQRVCELYIDKKDVQFLSFTVDPKRDVPSRLKKYAKLYNAPSDQWHFLTGDKKDLYRFARNGLKISATEGNGGTEDFIHSENLVLIDGSGFIRGYYVGTDEESVSRLINDITTLLKKGKA